MGGCRRGSWKLEGFCLLFHTGGRWKHGQVVRKAFALHRGEDGEKERKMEETALGEVNSAPRACLISVSCH